MIAVCPRCAREQVTYGGNAMIYTCQVCHTPFEAPEGIHEALKRYCPIHWPVMVEQEGDRE